MTLKFVNLESNNVSEVDIHCQIKEDYRAMFEDKIVSIFLIR